MWTWISVAGNIVLLVFAVFFFTLSLTYAERIMRLKKRSRKLARMLGAGETGAKKFINRAVAVIKPKQRYLDWIQTLGNGAGEGITVEYLSEDCSVYLIPEYDMQEEAEAFIKRHFGWLFEKELEGWTEDRKQWPGKLDFRAFQECFGVEYHSIIVDLTAGVIIKSSE